MLKTIFTSIKTGTTRAKGDQYETLAQKYLEKEGLKLIDSNYFCRFGEIDLIMLDDNTLVFIEVRFRKQSTFGTAIASITATKRKKIIRTAEFFLAENKKYQQGNCRFDVIGIDENQAGEQHIDWIKNAFME